MATKKKQSLSKREERAVDKMMGSIAFISPLSATPQIITIFGKQQAAGVSLASWVMYLLIGLVTLAYGSFHKLRPIIISQALWSVVDILIIIGIVMYGSGRALHADYETLLLLNNLGKSLTVLSFAFGGASLLYWYKYKKVA